MSLWCLRERGEQGKGIERGRERKREEREGEREGERECELVGEWRESVS